MPPLRERAERHRAARRATAAPTSPRARASRSPASPTTPRGAACGYRVARQRPRAAATRSCACAGARRRDDAAGGAATARRRGVLDGPDQARRPRPGAPQLPVGGRLQERLDAIEAHDPAARRCCGCAGTRRGRRRELGLSRWACARSCSASGWSRRTERFRLGGTAPRFERPVAAERRLRRLHACRCCAPIRADLSGDAGATAGIAPAVAPAAVARDRWPTSPRCLEDAIAETAVRARRARASKARCCAARTAADASTCMAGSGVPMIEWVRRLAARGAPRRARSAVARPRAAGQRCAARTRPRPAACSSTRSTPAGCSAPASAAAGGPAGGQRRRLPDASGLGRRDARARWR
ncbi:MAG: hypothetical protein MZW92_57605 [Comamonadaceae bacterium]|nr:hypothetical protein [Comamonadaceae bacterium]